MNDIADEMRGFGIEVPSKRINISIKDADKIFWDALDRLLVYMGEDPVHSDDYNGVIEWLTNNNRKGIILMGSVGRGKTLIARFIIPLILNKVLGKTVSFHSMCKLNTLKDIQEVMKHKIIVLDDLGVENIVNEYGNKIDAFSMIVDEAEKENKLLIITTNLNKKLLLEKYKPRSYDRLMSMCKLVIFKNNSSLR